MNRKLVFALLCVATISAFAIAASIPEPIRTLSDVDKASVVAGDYCHYCTDCTEDQDCDSQGGASKHCPNGGDGTVCGYNIYSWTIDDQCIDGSGSLTGGCWEPEEGNCAKYRQCVCTDLAGGNTGCEYDDDASDEWVTGEYSQGNCP